MKDMNGLSLAKFRDKRLDDLLSDKCWKKIKKGDETFTLPEAYLLLHTDFDKFLDRKGFRSDEAKATMQQRIKDVLGYIASYYNETFRHETEQFIGAIIDNLYEKFDNWKNELGNLFLYWEQTGKKTSYWQEQLRSNIKTISNDIERLKERLPQFVENNIDWLKETRFSDLQQRLDTAIQNGGNKSHQYKETLQKAPSIFMEAFKLSQITPLRNEVVDPKMLKPFFLDDERYNKICDECRALDDIYKEIYSEMQKIFQMDFTIGTLRIEVQNSKNYSPITHNFLVALGYGLSACYNPEVSLLFLYNQHGKDDRFEELNIVIQKNENFYDALYQKMCDKNSNVCSLFQTYINYGKFAEEKGYYKEIGEKEKQKKKTIMLYKVSLTYFRQLFLMYQIVFPNESLCDCVKETFIRWKKILPRTRLTSFYCDERACIMSDFLMWTGLESQKALADILGKDESKISRAISSGRIFKDPEFSWFWMAVTGHVYDYLTGVVTTDVIGRDPKANGDMLYRIWPMEMISDGGKMLSEIVEFGSFKRNLSAKDSPYKRREHPLQTSAARDITALVLAIADKLYRIQVQIKRDIIAKNSRENNRVAAKKKGAFEQGVSKESVLQNESPKLDVSEIPRYQSAKECFTEINNFLAKEMDEMFPGAACSVYLDEIEKMLKKELDKKEGERPNDEMLMNCLSEIRDLLKQDLAKNFLERSMSKGEWFQKSLEKVKDILTKELSKPSSKPQKKEPSNAAPK